MRVFVAGASGWIGAQLVPQLIGAGHEVYGTHSSPPKAERVTALGAEPVMVDLLDPGAVHRAVIEVHPEAIIHQATALANVKFGRNLDKTFAITNALRTRGTDALLAAAREAGVRRFIGQSFAPYRYAREGGPVKTEDDLLDPTPPPHTEETYAAMTYLDDAVTAFGGIALRYGGFYGGHNDGLVEPIRKRQMPIVGDGGGVFPFVHLEDAAAATVLALEHEDPRSTTSSTTNPPRSGNGCRCMRRRWAPSRRGECRNGSRGCSPARPPSCSAPRPAAPRTLRPNGNSAGLRATRAGVRGSWPPTRDCRSMR